MTDDVSILAARSRAARARTRRSAIRAIVELGDPSALSVVVERLNDAAASVRERAVWGVRKLGGDAALTHLIRALSDPEPAVRRAAVRNLGRLGDSAAARPLSGMLADPHVALVAAFAMDDVGPDGVSELVEALNSADKGWAAASALAVSPRPVAESLPRLLDLLERGPDHIRTRVLTAIGRLGRAAEPSVPALRSVLSNDGADTANLAGRVLAHIGTDECVAALVEAARDDGPVWLWGALGLAHLGPRAGPAVTALCDRARQEGMGHWAIDVLGLIRNTSAVPSLIEVASRGPRTLRERAILALGAIGDPRATPCLMDALDEYPEPAAQALGMLPRANETTSRLQQLLASGPELRLGATVATALGAFGVASPDVVRALEAQLSPKNAALLVRLGARTPRIAPVLLSEIEAHIRELRHAHRRRVRYEDMDVDRQAAFNAAGLIATLSPLTEMVRSDAATETVLTRLRTLASEALDSLEQLRPFLLGPDAPSLWGNMPEGFTGQELAAAITTTRAAIGCL